MLRDSEQSQFQAVAAIEALQAMVDLLPPSEMIEVRHIGALLTLTNGAVRDALPKGVELWSAND